MWPDEDGNWSLGTAYEQPRTDSTVTWDLAGSQQAVDTSGTGSGWGGFGNLLDRVVSYGLQKDAAKTQAQLQQQQQQALTMQPLVSNSGAGLSINPTALLLVGGLVVGGILLARS